MQEHTLSPLEIVERCSATIFRPDVDTFPLFFSSLAKTMKQVSRAQHVIVWDNNCAIERVIAVAELPASSHVTAEPWLPLDALVSRAVLTECKIQSWSDFPHHISQNPKYNRALIDANKLNHLVAIPILNSAATSATGVIELYFDSQPDHLLQVDGLALQWLSRALGRAIDYLLLRLNGIIRHEIEKHVAVATGLTPLFKATNSDLKKYCKCSQVALYRQNEITGKLEEVEASGDSSYGHRGAASESDRLSDERLLRTLQSTCLEQRASVHGDRTLSPTRNRAIPHCCTSGFHSRAGHRCSEDRG